ncbi:bifunctional riboflavin kinase/FAD synthetase [Sediminibacillus albus]|uniref:Riboflavin biosynthesis protein n=1 Tax=Sediminibacillus albus TaxID=407036 RepID=A0A1G8W090_9BACI|nr:bifunctional riboflavin kinase/FAD synthetase [Sediminibacillus albus]SDJ71537.1 riboflavin kinase / FMN adenylyltransferase [Sediminibacillus albus]
MKTIQLSYPHQIEKASTPATVAAIGFFDGIHRGHQKVIKTAADLAKRQNLTSAVITFHPHPSVVLKKDKQHVSYLTPMEEKKHILSQLGIDRLYVITFNKQLSNLEPQAFVDQFLIGLHIKHLVAGFDFSYGHKGQGSMETISEHARGEFSFTKVEKVRDKQEKISSTLIRQHLLSGDVEEANHLLGRPLTIKGEVVEGDKRGRTIGFPTANLSLSENYFLPKPGVYAVTVGYQGRLLKGMANLGYKPTFNEEVNQPALEVHLFDFQEDLYGSELTVEWRMFIREEFKFDGVDSLVSQLTRDEQKIRTYLQEI